MSNQNNTSSRKIYWFAFLNLFFSIVSSGQSSFLPAPRISISHHQGVFHEQPVDYKATVKESFFTPDSGRSSAVSVITTSYIKENKDTSFERPVLFVFNGGPGASSSPLHMNAFGPWRIKDGKDSNALIENPWSLLDVIDLVFIDPPGTGFTRVFDDKSACAYWDVTGDAQLFINVIKEWKMENNRASSPVFLCGESYGTTRAAGILGLATDLPVAGAIFLSSLFDLSIVTPAPGNDMPYILYLPGMSSVAWYHHKLNKKIKSPEQAFNEAIRFAQNEYITALAQGINLSVKSKERIADKLSNIIGLDKKLLLKNNLRITPLEFQLSLLAKEEKRIGQLNGQMTGTLNNPGLKSPFDDPSMTMRPSTRNIVGKYFTQSLQFQDSLPYKTLNLDVNGKWNWSTMSEDPGYMTVAPYITKALMEQAKLKLFVAGGYYDLATPLYAARYILEHIGVPSDRVTYSNFHTGHSIFEKEEDLINLSRQIRLFILDQIKK
ncbi:MAG: hypothetical protein ABI761_11915 [Saprospiraceae bacterium]